MNPTNIDILMNANREIINQKEEEALKFIEEIKKGKTLIGMIIGQNFAQHSIHGLLRSLKSRRSRDFV